MLITIQKWTVLHGITENLKSEDDNYLLHFPSTYIIYFKRFHLSSSSNITMSQKEDRSSLFFIETLLKILCTLGTVAILQISLFFLTLNHTIESKAFFFQKSPLTFPTELLHWLYFIKFCNVMNGFENILSFQNRD